MSRQFFGTDGVRGAYGGPVINDEFAARLGFALATWWRRAEAAGGSVPGPPAPADERVLIGRDTRASGVALEAALARGLRAAGVRPVSLGVVPTPAVARAVRAAGAPLGIVITASHNPAADNGIKIFGRGGVKLTDDQELAIESCLGDTVPAAAGAPEVAPDALTGYLAGMEALLPAGALAGWKLVVDTANGATWATTPVVLRRLGAEVVGLGDAPDGYNINAGVGSEHPQALADRVRREGAMAGVAHDGDGDRCVLCDERGGILDGDEVLTLLAVHALARGQLARNTLVVTQQSNLGVDAAIATAGGTVERTPIGDRYVIERLRATGASLGGESSGHIVCADVSPTGDGLVAALRVFAVMLETGRPLSELRGALRRFPQRTLALRVTSKPPLPELPRLTAAVRAVESELGRRGRVLVRYSGTEPLLRLLVEGPDESMVAEGLERIRRAVAGEGIVAPAAGGAGGKPAAG
jgi:phosphoglucosamine mutase